jgi:hypothetical protein
MSGKDNSHRNVQIMFEFHQKTTRYIDECAELLGKISVEAHHGVEMMYVPFLRVLKTMNEKLGASIEVGRKAGIKFDGDDKSLPDNVVPLTSAKPKRGKLLDLTD